MLVVFDWDGTLCDSLSHIVTSLRAAAVQLGLPVPAPSRARSVIGLGLAEALEELFPGLGVERSERLRQMYRQHYAHPDRPPERLYPDALNCLSMLRAAGVTMAVATGKSRAGLQRALDETGLEGWFAATRTAEETASKPDPTMLNQVMAELGFAPGQTVLVGDTTFDLDMAAAAGVARVGLTHGAHCRSHLERCAPEVLFDGLAELGPWLLARRCQVVR